jgi:hypothetical protein
MKYRIKIGRSTVWPYEIQIKERDSIFFPWIYLNMEKTLEGAEATLKDYIFKDKTIPKPTPKLGKVMKVVTEADILVIKLKGK